VKNIRLIMTMLLVYGLCACTVMQLKNEVAQDEVRLATKEDELKSEEARQVELKQQIKLLQDDLATRQMSLDDLKSRLAELQQANASTSASTKEQQALKRKRATKLQAHQKEVTEIQQSGATIAEKRQRLEHLKGEIRKSLNLLVYS
jgi:chromosome segregation ATPase